MAVWSTVAQAGPACWDDALDELFSQVLAPFFGRREPRLRARACLEGLLSDLERKNGWSLAEYAGDTCPDGMQRLFNHARWDADQVRDALRAQVGERFGDLAGVLVIDDTGFEKKGGCSAGVQRQYTGTAGKITNCQIGVFASYSTPSGRRVLIDRELYLPAAWFAAPHRLAEAGVPPGTVFATKPELAWKMIERAADDVLLSFGWVTGDEAYGDNTVLRERCRSRGLSQVFAVSCDHPITVAGAKTRADRAVAALPASAWQRYSCGQGAKGHRFYDWAWITLGEHGSHDWLLARRSISDPCEVAYYRCWSAGPAALTALVRVAGARWSIEECFQATKNEAGLDHYQVRKHIAWYRYVTLVMVAHVHLAFLSDSTTAPPPTQGAHGRTITAGARKPHRPGRGRVPRPDPAH
ncbi:IS701 family transposase, partial [Nonomuraea mesophila]|uniref:IS701 family transposase n=1 Tax=Nonomuraea mesophila TaxID=2530382 RepID=UPI003CCC800B